MSKEQLIADMNHLGIPEDVRKSVFRLVRHHANVVGREAYKRGFIDGRNNERCGSIIKHLQDHEILNLD